MTILDEASCPVNSEPEPFTLADLQWAAVAFNSEPEPDWDWLAAESEALDRLCMGLCL